MLTSNRMQPDVMMTKTITDGKRVWDKVHYSVYCDGAYKKLPRHLVTKHAEVTTCCTSPQLSKMFTKLENKVARNYK